MKIKKNALLIAGSLTIALGFSAPTPAPAQQSTETILNATPSTSATGNQLKLESHETVNANSVVDNFSKSSRVPPNRKNAEFRSYSNYDDLLKMFPDVAQIVRDYGPTAKDILVTERGTFAQITKNLYVYRAAEDDCGADGCVTVAFSVNENGFYPSYTGITASAPSEYEVDKYGEPAIFYCTANFQLVKLSRTDGLTMTAEVSETEDCLPYLGEPDGTAPSQPAPRP